MLNCYCDFAEAKFGVMLAAFGMTELRVGGTFLVNVLIDCLGDYATF